MDTLILSRFQFAVTAMFHFLFVPLTLGLGWLVAWFETRYVYTYDGPSDAWRFASAGPADKSAP